MPVLSQIFARLQLLIAQGHTLITSKHTIQIVALDDETLDNIDRIQPFGLSYRPKKGSQAFVAFPSGDRSHGLCLVVGDTRYTVDLAEGEACLHDDQGQQVHLTRGGIVIKGAGKPITITDTPKVRIESDLDVTGEIKDRCDNNGQTMHGMRNTYNNHNHTGDDGGNTSNPHQHMGGS